MGARHLALALTAAAVITTAAACGHQAEDDRAAPPPTTETNTTTTAATAPQATSPPGQAGTAMVARAHTVLAIHPAPDTAPTTTLPALTDFGSPRALLVVQDQGPWLEVALPVRPNGSTGWIRRDDVDLRVVDESIEVDIAARTLTLWDAGQLVLTTPVAVGAADAPTPQGSFYVVDKLATGDPTGPYGLFAFGLSAFSGVFTDFAGGDGQVGIHGTNDPASIGQPVSHGCIRVPNDVSETLNQLVSLGTPVTIR